MRVAFPLGGTDWGRSGIGIYVREIVPRLSRQLNELGGELAVVGSPRDFEAYQDVLGGAMRVSVSELVDRPAASALWYLTRVGAAASASRSNVLLLPAGNRRLAWRSGLPTVAVVHDLAQLHVARKYDALRMFYLKRVVMGSLGRVEQLVAVSQATKNDLEAALPAEHAPIRVVLNGVDHERFRPMAADSPEVLRAREELGITGDYLLYASRLEHPGKNHLRLIEAYAKSSVRESHALVLAGKDWGAESLIDEKVTALGLGDRVRRVGFVADEILPGLVAGAGAVIMLGLREGFGLPALEALSAGRIVCVSSTGALPEVVGELGVVVDPFDLAAIQGGLERCVHDERLRDRAEKEGPSWAEAHGWDATAAGLIEACQAAAETAGLR